MSFDCYFHVDVVASQRGGLLRYEVLKIIY